MRIYRAICNCGKRYNKPLLRLRKMKPERNKNKIAKIRDKTRSHDRKLQALFTLSVSVEQAKDTRRKKRSKGTLQCNVFNRYFIRFIVVFSQAWALKWVNFKIMIATRPTSHAHTHTYAVSHAQYSTITWNMY